jgi:thiol:disulfide interchange protein DsbD
VKLQVSGLPQEFKAEFFPMPPSSEVRPDHPKITNPAADGSRTVTVPISEGGSPNLPWQGLLVTSRGDAPREGWLVSSEGSSASPAAQSPRSVKSISLAGLMAVIWGAFLGGLILNLMPCVLPVIALKIFGFVQQAGEEPRRIFRLGLAFVAGVFTFFLAIAVVVIALNAAGRSFNWGFQFQNPYLLISLLVLVFVFALSMFGLFEVTLGGGAATKLDQLAHKGGYGGAFMHGLFTTLLGTSCTAPFLGPVLGFAVAQSPPVVLTIFLAIAAGMSLPYFLLTWRPAWMRYLPKPGVWMERVKQFMGFALLGVVVWLLGVYGESRGVTSLVSVICFLLALGLACWIFGAFRRSPLAYVAIVAVIAGAWWGFLAPKKQSAIAWQPFTPERVAAAAQSGQPVFIDFTADWCLNCKYNEKFVIDTEPVRAAIRDKNLLMLQADWTDSDPVITEWLNKFGRVGVPLYVLYVPGSEEPVVMPELLTQNLLLKHFSAIPKEPPAASRLSRAP